MANGWPDKPGVPVNPEQDGWHWLATDDTLVLCEWTVARGWRDEHWFWCADELPYLGPCLTPSEHAAVIAAEREACAGIADALAFQGMPVDALGLSEREKMLISVGMKEGAFTAAAAIRARGKS